MLTPLAWRNKKQLESIAKQHRAAQLPRKSLSIKSSQISKSKSHPMDWPRSIWEIPIATAAVTVVRWARHQLRKWVKFHASASKTSSSLIMTGAASSAPSRQPHQLLPWAIWSAGRPPRQLLTITTGIHLTLLRMTMGRHLIWTCLEGLCLRSLAV